MPADYIEKEKEEQREEIKRRTALYRRHSPSDSMSPHPPLNKIEEYDYPTTADKTIVLLIDDGIATGATVIVAARWIRAKYKPAKLI